MIPAEGSEALTEALFVQGTNKMISKCDGDAFFEKCSFEFGSPNLKRPP